MKNFFLILTGLFVLKDQNKSSDGTINMNKGNGKEHNDKFKNIKRRIEKI